LAIKQASTNPLSDHPDFEHGYLNVMAAFQQCIRLIAKKINLHFHKIFLTLLFLYALVLHIM